MTKVLIVYATDYGNTEKLANAVAEEARSVPNAKVELLLQFRLTRAVRC